VAPQNALSGCSHRVTTNGPIRVCQREDGFAIDGTPADCVRLGLHGIVPDTHWILSGINAGGNLGADVYHSGTVAAVREGVLHGRPGIAWSLYRQRDCPPDWDRAARWVFPVLRDLMAQPWKPGLFWNVNLPHLATGEPDPEVVFCPLDSNPLPISFHQEGDFWHYAGNYHLRSRSAGSDVDICFRGKIAVTPLELF
jgi:5'-nucleotidase